MNGKSDTPQTDALEPTIRHLEAQLPETRRALEAERRHAHHFGMMVEEERPDGGAW